MWSVRPEWDGRQPFNVHTGCDGPCSTLCHEEIALVAGMLAIKACCSKPSQCEMHFLA